MAKNLINEGNLKVFKFAKEAKEKELEFANTLIHKYKETFTKEEVAFLETIKDRISHDVEVIVGTIKEFESVLNMQKHWNE